MASAEFPRFRYRFRLAACFAKSSRRTLKDELRCRLPRRWLARAAVVPASAAPAPETIPHAAGAAASIPPLHSDALLSPASLPSSSRAQLWWDQVISRSVLASGM